MEYRITINSEPDATRAVMQVRRSATAAGFDATRVTMLGTVASELVRNILKYARAGELIVRQVENDRGSAGLELVASDEGPGIADIDRAMMDHVSTSGTLGLGLPGVKRMTDEVRIESVVGKGTTVTVRKWIR